MGGGERKRGPPVVQGSIDWVWWPWPGLGNFSLFVDGELVEQSVRFHRAENSRITFEITGRKTSDSTERSEQNANVFRSGSSICYVARFLIADVEMKEYKRPRCDEYEIGVATSVEPRSFNNNVVP